MPRTFRFNGTLGVDLLRLSLRIAPKSFSRTRASTPVLSMIHAFSLWRCVGLGDYTNPIRSRVHTPSVPSGTAVLGKYLPKIRRRSRHELFWYLCWNCWWRSCHWADCSCAKAGFAARACTWAVQSFIGGGSCVPSSRLGSVPRPPEPVAQLPPPLRCSSQPSRNDGSVVARFDQRARCSSEFPSTAAQDRCRCGVEDMKFVVASRTGNVLALVCVGTLDNLCGSLADRGSIFLPSFRLCLCLFVSDRRSWVEVVHDGAACSVRTNFSFWGAIWTLSLRRSLEDFDDLSIAHFSNRILWISLFGWLSNCSISSLTVSFRFVSTWSTVECGMRGIRKSTRLLPQVSLYLWTSFSRSSEFLESVIVHPSERFLRSARVLREVTWVTDTLCSRVLHQSSCIPRSQYMSLAVCLKE